MFPSWESRIYEYWNPSNVPGDEPGEMVYKVIEVFYDDDGTIDMVDMGARWVGGNSLPEVRRELEKMMAALVLPVLTDDDLEGVIGHEPRG